MEGWVEKWMRSVKGCIEKWMKMCELCVGMG